MAHIACHVSYGQYEGYQGAVNVEHGGLFGGLVYFAIFSQIGTHVQ